MKLYTEGSNLEMGMGSLLGHMGVTREFDTDVPAESEGELLPDSCCAKLVEEEDRFTLYSRFEKGQLVMMLLEKGDEIHRYYISTASAPHKAMCCGTFLESDERNTKTNVNKAGLSGTYDVRVIIDDKKYETGVQVSC